MVVVALRLRLQDREGLSVSIDSDVAYDLRDALYDDASWQSSFEACDLVQGLLDHEDDATERLISPAVADDLVRGINHVAKLYDLPPALTELLAYLRPLNRFVRRDSRTLAQPSELALGAAQLRSRDVELAADCAHQAGPYLDVTRDRCRP